MRNRVMLHDIAAIGVLARRLVVLVMFKNLAAISVIVGYRTIIVRRRTTSCDIAANRMTFSPVLT